MLIRALIANLCMCQYLLGKTLFVPKFGNEKTPTTSFATIKKSSTVSTSEIALCLWVALSFENYWEVLSKNSKEGYSIKFDSTGNIITIDGVDIRFQFPPSYRFTPGK